LLITYLTVLYKIKVGTWYDYYTSLDLWEDENFASMNVINLLALLALEECMRNLMEFPELAALTIDQSTDDLVMIHHISKVGKSLKKSKNSEKVVALHGLVSPAAILRFKSTADLFSKANIVEVPLPSPDDFETFESTIDFKKLSPAKVDENAVGNKVVYKYKDTFRNIIVLPPFVVNAILSMNHRDAPSLAQTISAAAMNFKNQYKDDPDFV